MEPHITGQVKMNETYQDYDYFINGTLTNLAETEGSQKKGQRIIPVNQQSGNNRGNSNTFDDAIFIYIFIAVVACIICFNLILGFSSYQLVCNRKRNNETKDEPDTDEGRQTPELNGRNTSSTSTMDTNVSEIAIPSPERDPEDIVFQCY